MTFLFTTSFYPPYHVGGACVHVKYLAEELARRGHEIHVMHSMDAYRVKRGNKLPSQNKKEFNNLHLHSLESPIKKFDPLAVYTLGYSPYVNNKFLEFVKAIAPDIVHHHNISLLGSSILQKKGSYLSLYTIHDYWLICPTSNLLKNKQEICQHKSCFLCAIKSGRPPQLWRSVGNYKAAIQNIDLMIAPCRHVWRRLSQEVHCKTVIIPNFVPAPPLSISPPEEGQYFLFVGMLEVHKGILNLLEIFKDLSIKKGLKLVIVGDGSLRNKVTEFISKNSLEKFIFYKGFVDTKQLYSLYRGASALIMPSIWPENAPLVALEAISVGTPVIACNNGGLPEIVEKIDKELMFNDFTELRNILLNFSEKRLSREGIKQIYDKYFSPKSYIDKYFRAIEKMELQRDCT